MTVTPTKTREKVITATATQEPKQKTSRSSLGGLLLLVAGVAAAATLLPVDEADEVTDPGKQPANDGFSACALGNSIFVTAPNLKKMEIPKQLLTPGNAVKLTSDDGKAIEIIGRDDGTIEILINDKIKHFFRVPGGTAESAAHATMPPEEKFPQAPQPAVLPRYISGQTVSELAQLLGEDPSELAKVRGIIGFRKMSNEVIVVHTSSSISVTDVMRRHTKEYDNRWSWMGLRDQDYGKGGSDIVFTLMDRTKSTKMWRIILKACQMNFETGIAFLDLFDFFTIYPQSQLVVEAGKLHILNPDKPLTVAWTQFLEAEFVKAQARKVPEWQN